jgi:hypothetical protein
MSIKQSLAGMLHGAFARVDRAPGWLRSGMAGALLIYAFIIMRGGLIVLPLAAIYVAIRDPQALAPLLIGVLVVVPATGFLGGLAYGAVGQLTRRWGRTGRFLQFIAGAWVYGVMLVFAINPWMDHKPPPSLTSGFDWVIATVIGLGGGLELGFGDMRASADAA